MKIWKVILVTLVIFGAGVVTGSLLATKTHSTDSQQTNQTDPGASAPRALRMDFVDRLKGELDLSPEQLSKIETIVQESQKRTKEIWEQCSPEMHAEFKRTKEKISAVLTEEQQQKFIELMKQRRSPPRKPDEE